MLGGVLDLHEVEVGEIMTHRTDVKMIDASLSSGEIVSTVLERSHTRLPLYRDDPDNILGVLPATAPLREVQSHAGPIDDRDGTTVGEAPSFGRDWAACAAELTENGKERR